MRTLELHVAGMGCRRCVREVTARLRDVPGVVTVTADAATCRVTVAGAMSREDVLDALAGSSHVATVTAEPPPP